jgi:hypothetical protein
MAHFAELDANNLILRVLCINDKDTEDAEGHEVEAIGIAFCQRLWGGTWLQTSYNTRGGVHYIPNVYPPVPSPDQSKALRKNYAGVGYTYRADIDGFVPPQPYPSWILNPTTGEWEPPIPYPNDGKDYYWDEATQSWVEVPQS